MSKNTTVKNPMKVITGENTRWSYANVWEPKSINGGTPKYSVSLIIPKSDTKTQCQPDHPEVRHQDHRQDQGCHRSCLRRGRVQAQGQLQECAASGSHQDASP